MGSFTAYLIEAGIYLSIFYMFYYLFLRNDKNYRFNRMYLIASILAAEIIPKLPLRYSSESVPRYFTVYLEEVTAYSDRIVASEAVNSNPLWLNIYWIGVIIFAFIFLLQNFMLFRYLFKGNVRKIKNSRIIVIDKNNIQAFSYLGMIFIGKNQLNQADLDKIIAHEKEHIKHFHSIDIFLVELLKITQWFNPIVWLMRISIKELHEYQADDGVLRKGIEPVSYKTALMNSVFYGSKNALVRNFNKSQLKKRLQMINKKQSRWVVNMKVIVLAPFILVLIAAFNFPSTNKGANANIEEVYDTLQFNNPTETKAEEVYFVVEDMPKFPSGDEGKDESKFRQYIAKNIQYPEECASKGISGKIFVQFVVTSEGNVDDVKIVRSIYSKELNTEDKKIAQLLDNEAKRVVSESPKWTPGKQRGEAVPVAFTFPISFSLK